MLHDHGLNLFKSLEDEFSIAKSNYAAQLHSTSISPINITIPDIRKRPRSEEGSNPRAMTSRIRAATNFFTPTANKQERRHNQYTLIQTLSYLLL